MSKPEPLDSLAERSLKQHMLMLKMLRPLQTELETSSLETVTKFNENFRSLQHQLKCTDKKLIHHLEMTTIPDKTKQLLEQRQAVQKEILQLLKHSVPIANSIKSFMAGEIQSVKKGRKALSGYKIQPAPQGRIVNRTS